jgi:hypothetical protein
VHESFDAHFGGNFGNIASTDDVDLVRIEISAGPPLSGEIDNDVATNRKILIRKPIYKPFI